MMLGGDNMRAILVTGGAGFIGSNFIRYFLRRNTGFVVINLDKLTYAGNLNNLKDIEYSPRYHFIKGDICNYELVNYILRRYKPEVIINFAAESHVDRSIDNPSAFAETNIMGTLSLLDNIRQLWGKSGLRGKRFLQVSTDEVYGSLDQSDNFSTEESNLLPNSPYSASKAAADLMIRSYYRTFKLPVIVTRCCNNYGPYQHPEKFIPKCITSALKDIPIPIYGDGMNRREWIYVLDHCTALIKAIFYGKPGEIYNIGTGYEISNLDLARKILKQLGKPQDRIEFIKDRPGHDLRYALNSGKSRLKLNWRADVGFEEGLHQTVSWYKKNPD